MAAREAHCPKTALVACTDGSGNTKDRLGSWAFVVYLPGGTAEWARRAKGKTDTTNNLMEMEAVIQALRWHQRTGFKNPLHIVSDSRYVIDGITNWIYGWQKRGWVRGDGKPVGNREKWEEMFALVQVGDYTFQHVRGHRGHVGNELADKLCTEAVTALRQSLIVTPAPSQDFASFHS